MFDHRNYNTPIYKYSTRNILAGISNVEWNKAGTHFLVSECFDTASLYSAKRNKAQMKFVKNKPNNHKTGKTFRFGGPDDEYVLGGFDDKKLCYWKILPDPSWKNLFNIKNKSIESFDHEMSSSEEMNIEKDAFTYGICRTICSKTKDNIVMNNMRMELIGFNSIVNQAVMHPKIPRIFATGIENILYAFSPDYLGQDDPHLLLNSDTIEVFDQLEIDMHDFLI
ncbi:hypothetical protein ECANGB1_799 [Enterospora canceri]|uniref:Uncharacterized protein n=1 Tax=Enterospora canceri TaxID=1081671 RepID=A0A1Y1S7F2_9MICR|nr:hypothetical protein ECANGB1_799 [Enterospora canceri]